MTSEEIPEAWRDLIAALTLLARGRSYDLSPLHCEHAELTVLADPDKFTEDEIKLLGIWGFHIADGKFYSYRYGS